MTPWIVLFMHGNSLLIRCDKEVDASALECAAHHCLHSSVREFPFQLRGADASVFRSHHFSTSTSTLSLTIREVLWRGRDLSMRKAARVQYSIQTGRARDKQPAIVTYNHLFDDSQLTASLIFIITN